MRNYRVSENKRGPKGLCAYGDCLQARAVIAVGGEGRAGGALAVAMVTPIIPMRGYTGIMGLYWGYRVILGLQRNNGK